MTTRMLAFVLLPTVVYCSAAAQSTFTDTFKYDDLSSLYEVYSVTDHPHTGQPDIHLNDNGQLVMSAMGSGGNISVLHKTAVFECVENRPLSFGARVSGLSCRSMYGTEAGLVLHSLNGSTSIILSLARLDTEVGDAHDTCNVKLFYWHYDPVARKSHTRVILEQAITGSPDAYWMVYIDGLNVEIKRNGEKLCQAVSSDIDYFQFDGYVRPKVVFYNRIPDSPAQPVQSSDTSCTPDTIDGNEGGRSTAKRLHRIRRSLLVDDLTVRVGPLKPYPAQSSAAYWSFEGGQQLPFQIQMHDNAEGQVEVTGTMSRIGEQSLRIAKSNSRGLLHLRSTEPIELDAESPWLAEGYFHTHDAPISALFQIRLSTKTGIPSFERYESKSGLVDTESLLCNSSKGNWQRRLACFEADTPQKVYVHILAYGNPYTLHLDDLRVYRHRKELRQPVPSPGIQQDAAETLEFLESRPDDSATVHRAGHRTALMIRGQDTLPAFYKSSTMPIRIVADKFAQAGINMVYVPVHIGQYYHTTGLWTDSTEAELEAHVDTPVMQALRQNPHANILITFLITHPRGWPEEHPDEMWKDHNGRYVFGWGLKIRGTSATIDLNIPDSEKHIKCVWASHFSTTWRDQATGAMQRVVDYMKTKPYWKTCIGFQFDGGDDGQWFVGRPHAWWVDFSKPAITAFQKWTMQRYTSLEAVNQAWGTEYTNAADIVPPQPLDLTDPEAVPLHLVAKGKRQVVDYARFTHENTWNLRDFFAQRIKATAGKPVISTAYGSMGQYMMSDLSGCKYLDAGAMMSYYPLRRSGYPLGFHVPDSFKLHNKMVIQEMDLRSYASLMGGDELHREWLGVCRTPDQFVHMYRRLVGFSLAKYMGYWHYEFKTSFEDPALLDIMKPTTEAARDIWSRPDDFRPDVCLVQDRNAYTHYGSSLCAVGMYDINWRIQVAELQTSGVPYDVYDIEDIIANPQLHNYKVYIFACTPYLDRDQRQFIETTLKHDGKILIWIYDAGYLSERGANLAAMSELIGVHANTQDTYSRQVCIVDPASHTYACDVLPFQGAGELYLAACNYKGPNRLVARYQPFWIDDTQATTMATCVDTGQSLMAVRQYDNWTSVYLASPLSLSARMLNNIATDADAYVCAEPGQEIIMNGRFMCIHGLKSVRHCQSMPRDSTIRTPEDATTSGTDLQQSGYTARYTITLPPGRTTLRDVFTNERITSQQGRCTIDVIPQRTYWYHME